MTMFTCLRSVSGSCMLMYSVAPKCLFSQLTLSSHSTSQYFCLSAWWHWWQPHKTFRVRAVSISADRYIIGPFLFSKEQAITFSTCPWILKAWLTVTHSRLFFISHTHNPLWLCYIIQAKKWLEGSTGHVKETGSAAASEKTVPRARKQHCPLIHRAGQHTEIEECHRQIKACFCPFVCVAVFNGFKTPLCTYRAHLLPLLGLFSHNVAPWLFPGGGWLHLFIYTGIDWGLDWLSNRYWGLDQRGDAVFFLG